MVLSPTALCAVLQHVGCSLVCENFPGTLRAASAAASKDLQIAPRRALFRFGAARMPGCVSDVVRGRCVFAAANTPQCV